MNAQGAEGEGSVAYAYEAVFCIFLVAIAFLGRDSAGWAYPQVLYLLLLLLALNLAAGFALRRWQGRRGLSAGVILGNCAVISAILEYSGGGESPLWVLYLLPIFTASMFLTRQELGWVAVGAVGFNLAFGALSAAAWSSSLALDLGLRTGILSLAAVLTWWIADRERRAQALVRSQRAEMGKLLEEAQVREKEDSSTRRLAEVGLVTAGVLHDLRTPLTVILGSCEAGMGEESSAAARDDFERIRRAGNLCRDIVNQILAAAGQDRQTVERCDMVQVLDTTLAMCEEVLKSRKIELRWDRPEDPLPFQGSYRQIQRLFLNLVSNAAQAMSSGGVLTIEAKPVEPPAPGLPPRVQVIVADSGPGLSEKALAGLFKLFSTTKSGQGGTGLGLYMCRQIAISHRGSLVAENRPEGGARFTLVVPMDGVASPMSSPSCSSKAS